MNRPWDHEPTPLTDAEVADLPRMRQAGESYTEPVASQLARDMERRARHAEARAQQLAEAIESMCMHGCAVPDLDGQSVPYQHNDIIHGDALAAWAAHLAAAREEDAR